MLSSSGIAGMCSKTAVAPLDRIKILLQAHQTHYKHLNVFSGLINIVKKESFIALYKGNGAQMVRIFPYAATQFTAFEIYKKVSVFDWILLCIIEIAFAYSISGDYSVQRLTLIMPISFSPALVLVSLQWRSHIRSTRFERDLHFKSPASTDTREFFIRHRRYWRRRAEFGRCIEDLSRHYVEWFLMLVSRSTALRCWNLPAWNTRRIWRAINWREIQVCCYAHINQIDLKLLTCSLSF